MSGMGRQSGGMPVEKARDALLASAVLPMDIETLPLTQALGRVVAQPLVSPLDVPPVATSAMDGYALNTQDLSTSGETRLPVSQRITAGQTAQPLAPGTAARLFTGSPVPAGADTVLVSSSS